MVDEGGEVVVARVGRHLISSEPMLRDRVEVTAGRTETANYFKMAVLCSKVKWSGTILAGREGRRERRERRGERRGEREAGREGRRERKMGKREVRTKEVKVKGV